MIDAAEAESSKESGASAMFYHKKFTQAPGAAEVTPDHAAARQDCQRQHRPLEAAALQRHAAKIKLHDAAAAEVAAVERAAADVSPRN